MGLVLGRNETVPVVVLVVAAAALELEDGTAAVDKRIFVQRDAIVEVESERGR